MTLAQVVSKIRAEVLREDAGPASDLRTGKVTGLGDALMWLETDPDFALRERIEAYAARCDEWGFSGIGRQLRELLGAKP